MNEYENIEVSLAEAGLGYKTMPEGQPILVGQTERLERLFNDGFRRKPYEGF